MISQGRTLTIATLVALAFAPTSTVRAVDMPVPGKLMISKDGKIFKAIAKASGSFTLPSPGGPSDPLIHPSSLQVDQLAGPGLLAESDLATGLWRGLGSPPGAKGYVYTNAGAAPGSDPVLKIIFKEKLLKIIARDDGTLDGPIAGDVGVFLTLGGDTYCARFGGTLVKNTDSVVKRKDADPPADCSVPPPPMCANGIMEPPEEECDDNNTTPGDGCSATCQLESTNPALCAGVPSASGTALDLELVAEDLEAPVFVGAPRLDTNRIFIVEQPGRIRIVKNGSLLGTPFLAIEGSVAYGAGSEEGLLSVAFDPDYESNGLFYVYYVNNAGDLVIARYTASGDPGTSDDADETSEVVVTTVPHPGAGNHNGGNLQFGPDGFLYAGIGDGGGSCDTGNNAQSNSTALGKLLRLDTTASFPIDPVTAIWAKGLRNPFRLSFDRGNGDLYIVDVGQNGWEEVNYDATPVSSSVNYGWNFFEGTHCSEDPPSNCAPVCPAPAGFEMPVLEYSHSFGCSIAGGYAYRGCAMTDMQGVYFYSDYCSSFVRTFQGVSGGVAQNQTDRTADVDPGGVLGNVSSFGEDARGEMYICDHAGYSAGDGKVYRIVLE